MHGAGLCATAFHPLCAREAKLYMEVSSREDSEDVSNCYQVVYLSSDGMEDDVSGIFLTFDLYVYN